MAVSGGPVGRWESRGRFLGAGFDAGGGDLDVEGRVAVRRGDDVQGVDARVAGAGFVGVVRLWDVYNREAAQVAERRVVVTRRGGPGRDDVGGPGVDDDGLQIVTVPP